MRKYPNPCVLRAVMLLTGFFYSAEIRAEKLVVAFSRADPAYEASRRKEGKLLPQTYVFVEGRFLGGTVRDPQLEKTPFRHIARKLAVELKEQEFHPSKKLETADLMLIVHWGATSPRRHEHQLREMNQSRNTPNIASNPAMAEALEKQREEDAKRDGGFDYAAYLGADPSRPYAEAVEQDLFAMEAGSSDVSVADVAATLGISEELRQESAKGTYSEHYRTLSSFLQEERYFIIVAAYDAQKFFKTKQLQRLWISKLSIRSPGVNFQTAVERMGRVGSNFFGTNQEQLRMKRAPMRKGDVEIGELILISQEESE